MPQEITISVISNPKKNDTVNIDGKTFTAKTSIVWSNSFPKTIYKLASDATKYTKDITKGLNYKKEKMPPIANITSKPNEGDSIKIDNTTYNSIKK